MKELGKITPSAHRLPTRLLLTVALLGIFFCGAPVTVPAAAAQAPRVYPGAPGAEPDRRTLVLYDTSGEYGWLGESYAVMTGNLVSHSSSWVMRPVHRYQRGEGTGYTAIVYVGSTEGESLPAAFLGDTLASEEPVFWMSANIGQLVEKSGDFASRFGWQPGELDTTPVTDVAYRDTAFQRHPAAAAQGILRPEITAPALVEIPAQAVRPDGSRFPWAVRSRQLTYLGELPFSFTGPDDRYLAAADLLSRHADPDAPDRKQALIRIEDVGPNADPTQLREIADSLAARRVPFSVGVYPRYRDPRGVHNNGKPVDRTLADAPEVVDALRYMLARRGTLVMHGYTHQHGEDPNPYNGVSGEDYEFYRVELDERGEPRYPGPVPGDSRPWAAGRLRAAVQEFSAAGLPVPDLFEFPHYVGSALDYDVVHQEFSGRYDQGFYATGWCADGDCGSGVPDYKRTYSQAFPFLVRDIHGSPVIPESLDHVTVTAAPDEPRRLPRDILASARRVAVVRDGVASFFYHPYLGTTYLDQVVAGIQTLGFRFVGPAEVRQG